MFKWHIHVHSSQLNVNVKRIRNCWWLEETSSFKMGIRHMQLKSIQTRSRSRTNNTNRKNNPQKKCLHIKCRLHDVAVPHHESMTVRYFLYEIVGIMLTTVVPYTVYFRDHQTDCNHLIAEIKITFCHLTKTTINVVFFLSHFIR